MIDYTQPFLRNMGRASDIDYIYFSGAIWDHIDPDKIWAEMLAARPKVTE
jgi:uncharacterized 2Fe-2S/4Fe-4S cluster protein (DUF4445 family)